jgi:hypothetical protein
MLTMICARSIQNINRRKAKWTSCTSRCKSCIRQRYTFTSVPAGIQDKAWTIIKSLHHNAESCIKASFLLPTSNAAHFHILRVFHQVKQWIGQADNMEANDWGWSIEYVVFSGYFGFLHQ